MKKLITFLLSVVVFAGITGAVWYLWHADSAPKKKYTFDLIVKGTSMDFWKSVNEGAQAAAKSCNAAVSMSGPEVEEDYVHQVDFVEESIARKPDAIILAAADYSLLAEPVQHAIDSGIPVLMVDSSVNNSQTIAYVGTDNMKLGTALAQQTCRGLKRGSGEVGIVSFVKESYPAVQREEGFRGEMRRNSRFTVIDTAYGDSDVLKTENLTANMIISHPNLAAIASLNAQSSEGAAHALSKLGRKDIRLFAIDCTPDEATYMEEGVVQLALLQNPYQMGYYSVETAVHYLKGMTISNHYTDIYTVNKNTLFDDKYQQLIFPFS